MTPARRLPLLTEVLEFASMPATHAPAAAGAGDAALAQPATRAASPPAGAVDVADASARSTAAELLPVSEQMARAVLELELEQALREVLEPRLDLLLRETASELALRLEPRMRQWLQERGQ